MKILTVLCVIFFTFLPLTAESGVVAERMMTLRGGFDQPSDVDLDGDGNAYVLDGLNCRIVVFDGEGKSISRFDLPDCGERDRDPPMGLHVYDDRVFVAESGKGSIAVFDRRGRFLKRIGLDRQGVHAAQPEPVDLIVVEGGVYWTDRRNHRFCRTGLEGGETTCWAGKGNGPARFSHPFMLTADRDGYIHVVDVLNGRIQYFNDRGVHFGVISGFGLRPGELFRPNGIVAGGDDDLFVTDSYTGKVSLFDGGSFAGFITDARGEAVTFDVPGGAALWRNRLYVVEMGGNSVAVLRLGGDGNRSEMTGHAEGGSSRKDCVTCHLSWHPDYSVAGRKVTSHVPPVASESLCYSCHHGAVVDSRLAVGRGKQHPVFHEGKKERKGKRKDSIPAAFPLLTGGEPYCGTCHTPHVMSNHSTTYADDGGNYWMRVGGGRREICGDCHESRVDDVSGRKRPLRGVNHPVGVILAEPPPGIDVGADHYASTGSLRRGLPSKLAEKGGLLDDEKRLICRSCHGVHGTEGEKLLLLGNERGGLCTTCHADKGSESIKDARRKGIHPADFELEKPIRIGDKEVGRLLCTTCHSSHAGKYGTPLIASDIDEKTCRPCHERQDAKDREEARKKGVHPVNFEMEKPVRIGGKEVKKLTCITCHDLHGGREETPLLRKELGATVICGTCHKRQGATGRAEAEEKGVHPVDARLISPVRIGEKEVSVMTCLTCHSVHKGKKNTPALTVRYKEGELCENCHEGKKRVSGTDHDLRVTSPDGRNRFNERPAESGLCGTCHTMHRGRGTIPFLYAGTWESYSGVESFTPRDRLCFDCHRRKGRAGEKVVKDYTHPYKDIILRSRTSILPLFNGKEEKAQFGEIRCVTCHEPHRWSSPEGDEGSRKSSENREGTVLDSFLRRKGVKGTFCVDCHGLETRVKYKYYHDKRAREGRADYIE